MVLQRCSAMTQSASGRVNVSWERARVSARMRARKPRDKRLFFMSLWGLVCLGSLRTWCKVGARWVGWQQQKCAKSAHPVRGCSRVEPYVANLLGKDGT